MNIFLSDTLQLLIRHIRATLRLPIWIAVTLIQPVIWITIFGQLFQKVVDIPGFENSSYIAFLTPGVVIMTAMFGAAWSGMGLIEDLNQGVIDRMLSTPVKRGALIAARVIHASITVIIQSIIIIGLGMVLGAKIPGGILGIIGVLIVSVLIAAGFSSISTGIALLTRREETMIAVINFFGLPITFLSASFMSNSLMPSWMQKIAIFNPVNWAVNAARSSMAGNDFSILLNNSLLLILFTIIAGVFAYQSFAIQQKRN
ncbi:ABC transporter permease [Alphaproteobacteria bacterium]|nr:ABC transporter permease [Alphaproteobacteria bacterium]